MSSLDELQDRFVAALRDASLPPPEGLLGRHDEVPVRRFAIYRNNVHVALVEALRATYPVVARLVGAEFFRAMARCYVGGTLPRTPVVIDYGEDFPAFVGRFKPAASLPYLEDVARLEWLWSRAYHAADAEPVDQVSLAAVPTERLGALRLELHPSLRVLGSPWPILTIWHANAGGGAPDAVDLTVGGEDVLIVRPEAAVQLRRLPVGSRAFIDALRKGHPLAVAADTASATAPDFDLGANLAGLLGAGAVVHHHLS